MATLTSEIAQNLMYQAMTGGVPTAELNKYGGFEAVNRVAQAAGVTPTPKWIAGYEQKQGMPESEYTTRNKAAFSPGGIAYGNPDAGSWDGVTPGGGYVDTAPAGNGGAGGGGSGNTPSTDWQKSFENLQSQIAALQQSYNELVNRKDNSGGGGGGGSGNIVGGGVVDDGSSFNTPGPANLGNTGKVYGPDGKEYSSAAAAIAAGVTNFTSSPPQLGPGLIAGADTLNSQFLQPPANTGNANPGADIANQNAQLFNMGAPKVSLPNQIKNPFETGK
jgi:hypothetical protein